MGGHLRLADGFEDPGEPLIRVVLAEGHAAMRRSLRMLLDAEQRLAVVAEADDLAAALGQLSLFQPDVLVLDLRLSGGVGLEAIGQLREQSPGIQIVALTMHASPLVAKHAFDAGVTAFVLKDTADTELSEAVRCAARGSRYTSPRVTDALALLTHADPVPLSVESTVGASYSSTVTVR